MKKMYATLLATTFVMLFAAQDQVMAQKGPSNTDPNKRTRTVRDCEYEVVPGLAEITSIKKRITAEESLLKYDEYEVYFTFKPMEGDELIEQVKDSELEFVLRSGTLRVPVGPEYIKEYRLKEGTRYAMELLQTRNREACLERYTYDSKALRNDLFEADRGENLYNYKKYAFVKQQESQERRYQENKAASESEKLNSKEPEGDDPSETLANTPIEELPDYSNLSEAELRELAEKELRDKIEKNGVSSLGGADYGIDEAKIRAEMEAKLREEYAAQLNDAGNTSSELTAPDEKATNANAASDAIREAKRKAKEQERLKKEEEKRQLELEEEKRKKEVEIKAQIEEEIKKQIEDEIRAKEEAAKKRAEEDEKTRQEEMERKRKALEKKEEIKQQLMESIANETRRGECVFGERVSGVIEVVKVGKVKDANESFLGHTEYEVVVSFRPDNFGELSKKDRKIWEAQYTFTLDPLAKNANPGAGYIRKYKVFKASQYNGFAEIKQSGICNEVILYSPDLPNDSSKIKLQ